MSVSRFNLVFYTCILDASMLPQFPVGALFQVHLPPATHTVQLESFTVETPSDGIVTANATPT